MHCFGSDVADIKVAVQFAIDALQQVEIEGRGQMPRIVVGGVQKLPWLHQVEADHFVILFPRRGNVIAISSSTSI